MVFSQVRSELVGTCLRKTKLDVARPSTIKSPARSTMDHKFLWKKIMLPILQSSNKSIKFFIISRVIDMTPFEFLTKISYGVSFLKENSPNAYIRGITFYFKCLSKVRKG